MVVVQHHIFLERSRVLYHLLLSLPSDTCYWNSTLSLFSVTCLWHLLLFIAAVSCCCHLLLSLASVTCCWHFLLSTDAVTCCYHLFQTLLMTLAFKIWCIQLLLTETVVCFCCEKFVMLWVKSLCFSFTVELDL